MKRNILIGIGILVTSVIFLLLIGDFNQRNLTQIELRINDKTDQVKIGEVIQRETGFDQALIKYENKEGILKITTEYIDSNTMDKIKEDINFEAEIISYFTIGNVEIKLGGYVIYSVLIICILLGTFLIVKSMISIFKEKSM
jgi:hypothetical protein